MSLFKKLAYDPVKDFAPVARIGTTSFMLMVRPIRRSRPARSSSPTPGPSRARCRSATAHRVQVSLAMPSPWALDVVKVPYKSMPQAITDVLGGTLSFAVVDLGNALAQAKGGKLKGLAVTSSEADAARAGHARRSPRS